MAYKYFKIDYKEPLKIVVESQHIIKKASYTNIIAFTQHFDG